VCVWEREREKDRGEKGKLLKHCFSERVSLGLFN
jgi:hypothetical protein